jgi:RNA polymerase sigma-70 factor (ECF subfamily)
MHPAFSVLRTLVTMSREPSPLTGCGPQATPPLSATLAAVATGDGDALSLLYDATVPLVYSLAERLLGDPFRAEEAVLDVFRHVWERASSYDETRGSVHAWLMTITRGRSLDRLRSDTARRRREETLSEDHEAALKATQDDTASAMMDAEREDACARALRSLPPAQRQVVELAFFHGKTHETIAEELGTPLGTVKSQIRRGLLRMHDLLKKREDR